MHVQCCTSLVYSSQLVSHCSRKSSRQRSLCSCSNCSNVNCKRLANQSTSSYDVPNLSMAAISWVVGCMSSMIRFHSRELPTLSLSPLCLLEKSRLVWHCLLARQWLLAQPWSLVLVPVSFASVGFAPQIVVFFWPVLDLHYPCRLVVTSTDSLHLGMCQNIVLSLCRRRQRIEQLTLSCPIKRLW